MSVGKHLQVRRAKYDYRNDSRNSDKKRAKSGGRVSYSVRFGTLGRALNCQKPRSAKFSVSQKIHIFSPKNRLKVAQMGKTKGESIYLQNLINQTVTPTTEKIYKLMKGFFSREKYR